MADKERKAIIKNSDMQEDMQQDVRYEFDAVISIDKDTHAAEVVKDRIGFLELRATTTSEDGPLTINDGKDLARLAAEGISLEEVAHRKMETLCKFILNEKSHNATKVGIIEKKLGMNFTEESVKTISYDNLIKIVNYLKA